MHDQTTSFSEENFFISLGTHKNGLNESEVSLRQRKYGLNVLSLKGVSLFLLFWRQLTGNPLIIVLATATFISFLLGERVSAYYIFGMVLVSIFLGLWNEYTAEKTVENLLKKITPEALVIRNGEKQDVLVSHLTIGDIVLLSQGSIIPADLQLFEANGLEVNESSLTGEAKTVYKAISDKGFMGTTVESGSGKGVITAIGKQTEFGKIAKASTFIKPTTEFQKGLEKFGELIIKVILVLTVGIFIINALLGHAWLESLIFALAIAVGLTPELLPVIVTVSLSHGAGKLAKKHVIAKRLISLENLGNMDVLCTDKTGTLTEGTIQVVNFVNAEGKSDEGVLHMALLCNGAVLNSKVKGNAIDVALWQYAIAKHIHPDKEVKKIDEEEFDFNRKAMFTVVSRQDEKGLSLFAKGAPETILEYCSTMHNKKTVHEELMKLRNDGYRVIALAKKSIEKKDNYLWEDVTHLQFVGYISFLDIPKKTAKEAIDLLHRLNIQTKVITGDNEIITKKICTEVGMNVASIMTGPEMDKLSDAELARVVNETSVFARVSPTQKLRVILALQANGHTVGYLGDGINDLPALHNADVGISVNGAVDVAKDAASIVLLRKSLQVIAEGVIEGRKTFSNTIKYILMGTSSNFGNMFSAAGASFLLNFLPMTPVQILLNNALYDVSELTIPSDNVDAESLVKPRHWNIDFIKRYMLFFGPLSSIYDFLTFGVMLYFFHARGALFQTGWFIESLATQVLVVFVIRTSRSPFFLSRPSIWLTLTSLGIVVVGLVLPFLPIASALGFVTPPPLYFMILIVLVTTYVLLVETVKNLFLKKYSL
jgi:Mg2+-importing ATPase